MELAEPMRPGFGFGFGLARRLSVLRKLLRRLAPSWLSEPEAGKPGRGGSVALGWFERNLACRSVISWAAIGNANTPWPVVLTRDFCLAIGDYVGGIDNHLLEKFVVGRSGHVFWVEKRGIGNALFAASGGRVGRIALEQTRHSLRSARRLATANRQGQAQHEATARNRNPSSNQSDDAQLATSWVVVGNETTREHGPTTCNKSRPHLGACLPPPINAPFLYIPLLSHCTHFSFSLPDSHSVTVAVHTMSAAAKPSSNPVPPEEDVESDDYDSQEDSEGGADNEAEDGSDEEEYGTALLIPNQSAQANDGDDDNDDDDTWVPPGAEPEQDSEEEDDDDDDPASAQDKDKDNKKRPRENDAPETDGKKART
ncbi:hypothetical protein AG1IA_05674 [Rhizoctonia solani AG-1 IA]|uniref:Uncharacterized protein n=1 Tax=Thanatephorus cucumeris (strain AG1-IA) TaxID=983506 RepID=L8WQM9_THACA|nr:hypothetical protein AG1IA_05674 [Rhizoctonia solani AG-1 IA]